MSINTNTSVSIEELKKTFLDIVYPIGSYFFTEDTKNPKDILGYESSWEKVEGRVLMGASASYTVGSEGGEATHTLSEAEMPKHFHDSLRYQNANAAKFGCNPGTRPDTAWQVTYVGGQAQDYYVTGYTGGSQPHNNLQPYRAVNIWRRVA